jgi:hypothetical protein
MLSQIVLASLVLGIIASPAPQAPAAVDQPIPKTGDNGKPNGVFSFEMGKGGAGGKGGKARPLVGSILANTCKQGHRKWPVGPAGSQKDRKLPQ